MNGKRASPTGEMGGVAPVPRPLHRVLRLALGLHRVHLSPAGGIKAYSRSVRIPHPVPSHRQFSQSKGEKGVRGHTAEPKASDRFSG